MDTLVKSHHILLEYETVYNKVFGQFPTIAYNNGRYYTGGRSYQETQIVHKIREMEASLHEKELVNEQL